MGKPLHIQQASAGSGKTYALTKTYIRLLISTKMEEGGRRLRTDEELRDSLSHIMAVTFTNKATNEMKQRIVNTLSELAMATHPKKGKGGKATYMKDFIEEFGASLEEISRICRKALRLLLLNYSDFQVSTIDSFFQSILRAFTYETGLSDSFTLEIDSDYLSLVSVDETIDSVVTQNRNVDDENLKETQRLLNILMSDKSTTNKWNVYQKRLGSDNIYSILVKNAKKLEAEKYKWLRNELEGYFSDDTHRISQLYKELKDRYEQPIVESFAAQREKAVRLEEAYAEAGYGEGVFNKSVMERIQKAKSSSPFDKPFSQRPGSTPLRSLATEIKNTKANRDAYPDYEVLDSLFDEFALANQAWRDALASPGYKMWKIYKNQLIYLGLLHQVALKKKEFLSGSNIVELSDTNSILRQIISEDETPFIYERIGTRINHYLIDEFQDTSKMQWENLQPLLSESIGYGHDNLIIGDAKQSIYRFRNADHTLISKTVPEYYAESSDWSADPISTDREKAAIQKERLNTNWRSALRIVEFNNHIFRSLSNIPAGSWKETTHGREENKEINYFFSDNIRNIYSNSVQPPSDRAVDSKRGYVELTIEPGKKSKDVDWNAEDLSWIGYSRLGDLITELHSRGFRYRDIGVLTRSNKEGTAAVEAITKYNEEHPGSMIPVISDQSLLVSQALSVKLIILVLENVSRGNVFAIDPKWAKDYAFDVEKLSDIIAGSTSMALLSLTETIIKELVPTRLKTKEVSYLAAFQDAVNEFCNSYGSDVLSFLDWWKRHSESLSIVSPEDADSVRVITVHKSKGLEYKCVIIPKANFSFAPSPLQSEWIWVRPQIESDYELPPFLPVESNASLEGTPHESEQEEYREAVSLDGLNTAYVAFTRAREELYIFAPLPSHDTKQIGNALNKICDETMEEANGDKLLGIALEKNSTFIGPDGETMTCDEAENAREAGEIIMEVKTFTYGIKNNPEDVKAIYEEEVKEEPGEEDGDEATSAKIVSVDISEYRVTNNDRLRFRDDVLNATIEDVTEELPAWRELKDEGTLKHSIMSMTELGSDLPSSILKHKIKGLITAEQAERWTQELADAIESVRDYGWFDGSYEVWNERTILARGEKNERPDRIMLSPEKDVVIVDYKFGRRTEVKKYQKQIRDYGERLSRTGRFRNVSGYLWYVETGLVEKVM